MLGFLRQPNLQDLRSHFQSKPRTAKDGSTYTFSIDVPDEVWKVVLIPEKVGQGPQNVNDKAIAFGVLMNNINHNGEKNWQKSGISRTFSINEIESLTGLNFFSEIPDALEEQLESKDDSILIPLKTIRASLLGESGIIAGTRLVPFVAPNDITNESLLSSQKTSNINFGEININQSGSFESDVTKIRPIQIAFNQMDSIHNGSSKVSRQESRVPERSSSQISVAKISQFDIAKTHYGSNNGSSLQVSLIERAMAQISATQNSSSQVNFIETTSLQTSSTEIDASQVNLIEVDGTIISKKGGGFALDFNSREVPFPSSIARQQLLNGYLSHINAPSLTKIYSTAQTLWHTTTAININFEITNLSVGQLAEATITDYNSDGTPKTATISIDDDANGVGWFIDATPWDSSEFNTTLSDTAYRATTDSAAYGKYDLLTAIWHEMGHALGFINGYSQFDEHVRAREFVGDGFSATLTRDGSHLDSNTNPYSLMNSSLKPGERKLPSALELQILNAIRSTNADRLTQTNNLQAPLTSTALIGILNGTFDTPDDWLTRGNSQVTNGRAIIAEDPRYNSNFKQTFTVPNGAKYLQFTLLDTNLGNNLLSPGDAFEVALLDSHTHASLVNTATGLTHTDALLNIQHDGRMYLSSNIIPTGYGSLHSPQTFTVDISHITPGTVRAALPEAIATLYFDLLGFGNRDASVVFDNIRLISDLNNPPIAQDDTFSTSQNAPVTINPLNNDTDPDGAINPGSFTLNTNPTYGTLTLNDDGTLRYTPNPAFVGTDTFTYTVTGNNGDISNPATVTITVNNAAPSIDDIIVQSQVKEGTDATFQAIATDSGNLTYTWNFGDGTEAITGEKVTHKFANNGEYTGILTVTDELGAATQRQFTVKVDNLAPEIVSLLGLKAIALSFPVLGFLRQPNLQDPRTDLSALALSPEFRLWLFLLHSRCHLVAGSKRESLQN